MHPYNFSEVINQRSNWIMNAVYSVTSFIFAMSLWMLFESLSLSLSSPKICVYSYIPHTRVLNIYISVTLSLHMKQNLKAFRYLSPDLLYIHVSSEWRSERVSPLPDASVLVNVCSHASACFMPTMGRGWCIASIDYPPPSPSQAALPSVGPANYSQRALHSIVLPLAGAEIGFIYCLYLVIIQAVTETFDSLTIM